MRLYAQVDDAQAFLEMAASLGGTVVGEAQEVPGQGIKVCQFLDPEGNIFGVIQPCKARPSKGARYPIEPLGKGES